MTDEKIKNSSELEFAVFCRRVLLGVFVLSGDPVGGNLGDDRSLCGCQPPGGLAANSLSVVGDLCGVSELGGMDFEPITQTPPCQGYGNMVYQ